jgi:type IV pilus assembly protein PilE
MIVVAIVAFIASVALPSYQSQVAKTKRSEAQVALQSIAVAMETHYRKNLSYVGPTFYDNDAARNELSQTEIFPRHLPKDDRNADDGTATYRLEFVGGSDGGKVSENANTYTIRAVALNAQASADSACAILTLDHLGILSPAECWE